MKYEFRLKDFKLIFSLVEVSEADFDALEREFPILGVPLCFKRFKHIRPDTGELTGLVFTKVWPAVAEEDGEPIGELWADEEIHSDKGL